MSELHNQLSFISPDPRIFQEKLNSLQTSELADRIRVLTIWPSAVRDAISTIDSKQEAESRGRLERSQTPTTPVFKGRHVRYLSRGREYVEELLHVHSSSKPLRSPTPTRKLFSPRNSSDSFANVSENPTQQAFQQAIRRLQHVEEFELNWYMDKGAEGEAWNFSLFPEIWQTIGPNLRKLTLDVQLFKMNDIVKYCYSLPKLEELLLTIHGDTSPVNHKHLLSIDSSDTSVPYLINKLRPTLRHLSIKTIGHQQLSLNFQLLESFPYLTSLSLNMPLDSEHLQDPSGFRRLLNAHPHITDLSIRYAKCCKDCTDDGFGLPSGKHMLYSDVSLPALRSLEVGLHTPVPPFGSINPLYNTIARIGPDFTSLTFRDRNLKLDEIKSMLRLFPTYRLKKLSLFAKHLSPQLIDHIAHTCPALSSLSLEVETVVRSESTQASPAYQEDDVDGFSQALFNYAVDIENDRWRYVTWLLSDISIMQWQFKVGHQHNWACMKAIARVIPSLRSFAGKGHMDVGANAPVKPEAVQQRSRFIEMGLDEGLYHDD
ncbi:hypothetical protein D9613_009190 [Agrocybe pediades]|uniref:Uncharacterized protein n=1 Tax=Agrocybe pediades TaxID=84607 RepID=A0A8H4VW79_9AGAR|nr:hypothetical protein D9613_009190 [Agrocybe pediades]